MRVSVSSHMGQIHPILAEYMGEGTFVADEESCFGLRANTPVVILTERDYVILLGRKNPVKNPVNKPEDHTDDCGEEFYGF